MIYYDNKTLFLVTESTGPHDKMYSENDRSMLDHDGNTIEKVIRKYCVVGDLVAPEKIEYADSVEKVKDRVINSNIKILLHTKVIF